MQVPISHYPKTLISSVSGKEMLCRSATINPEWLKCHARSCLDAIFIAGEKGSQKHYRAALVRQKSTFSSICHINENYTDIIGKWLETKILKKTHCRTIGQFLEKEFENAPGIHLIRVFQKVLQGRFENETISIRPADMRLPSLPISFNSSKKTGALFEELIINGCSIAIFPKSRFSNGESLDLEGRIAIILAPFIGDIKINALSAFILAQDGFRGKCQVKAKRRVILLGTSGYQYRVSGQYTSIIAHQDTPQFVSAIQEEIGKSLNFEDNERLAFSIFSIARYILHHTPLLCLAKGMAGGVGKTCDLHEYIEASFKFPLRLLSILDK